MAMTGGINNFIGTSTGQTLKKTPLQLAQYFAGRVENNAYSPSGGLKPGVAARPGENGNLNRRNDGQLSKQELAAAIKSGKLSASEKNLALYLGNHSIGLSGGDNLLSHSDLVRSMQLRQNNITHREKLNAIWDKFAQLMASQFKQ